MSFFASKRSSSKNLEDSSFSSLEFGSLHQNSPTPSEPNIISSTKSYVPRRESSCSPNIHSSSSIGIKPNFKNNIDMPAGKRKYVSRHERMQSKRSRNRKIIEDQIKKYLSMRRGVVLTSNLILKVDSFPESVAKGQNSSKVIQSPISGAVNLRRAASRNMLACAQPSLRGIRSVLNVLREDHKDQEVLWVNLREEPLLYVNGRSVVLRERENPFKNLKYFRGMSKSRIEQLEAHLKSDVLKESQHGVENLLLHKENDSMRLNPFWEGYKPADLLTSKEVFLCFDMEGFKVRYKRLPTTPERTPPKNYFDLLVKYMTSGKFNSNSVLVFNCQTGRSRSTFALVTASLIEFWTSKNKTTGSSFNDDIEATPPMHKRYSMSSMSRLARKASATSVKISGVSPKVKHVRTGSKSRSNSLLRVALKAADQDDLSSTSIIDDLEENLDLPPISEMGNFTYPVFESVEQKPDSRSRKQKSPRATSVHEQPRRRNSLPQISLVERRPSALINQTNVSTMPRVLSGKLLSTVQKELDIEDQPNSSSPDAKMERKLLKGYYPPIETLLRLLEHGRQSKMHVDHFINECDDLLNLREVIFKYRNKAQDSPDERTRSFNLTRAATCLVRYTLLIVFDTYLNEQIQSHLGKKFLLGYGSLESEFFSDAEGMVEYDSYDRKRPGDLIFDVTFKSWLESRREIQRVVQNILSSPEESVYLQGESVSLLHALPMSLKVLQQRKGNVMTSESIIKLDVTSNHTNSLKPDLQLKIRGAKNFRQVQDTSLFGLASPTIGGAKAVLQYLLALDENSCKETTTIVWVNLRAEPMLYLSGKPHVLRSVAKPFVNLTGFNSVDPIRLEMAETRFKDDVLVEKANYEGCVLVHVENQEYELEEVWEELEENDDILTPREVFEMLPLSGSHSILLDYHRVAMSPEKEPSPEDIDSIFSKLPARSNDIFYPESDIRIVFNCQIGEGRSTMALVLSYLYLYATPKSVDVANLSSKPIKNMNYIERLAANQLHNQTKTKFSIDENETDVILNQNHSSRGDSFRNGSNQAKMLGASSLEDDSEASFAPSSISKPDFTAILELVRVLKNGGEAKRWADLTIDKCGGVENIRDKIDHLKSKADCARSKEKSATYIGRALTYLKRYFMAISVASYVLTQREKMSSRSALATLSVSSSDGPKTRAALQRRSTYDEHEMSAFTKSQIPKSPVPDVSGIGIKFSEWFKSRRELQTLLKTLDDKSGLHTTDDIFNTPQTVPLVSIDFKGSPGLRIDVPLANQDQSYALKSRGFNAIELIAQRQGKVLGKGSILKLDHFPGCYRLQNPQHKILGSPNFRPLPFPEISNLLGVFGTGIPSIRGLKGIFTCLKEFQLQNGNKESDVVWVNLREEPILYVNGDPFVVRKFEHPFENLEYTGITSTRVQNMEQRLKEDVQNEVVTFTPGTVLLHGEDDLGVTAMKQALSLTNLRNLITPKELYESLRATGEATPTYFRVPITDEQAPKLSDFDKIFKIASTAPISYPFVLNCQMGRGRTTTGVILVVIVRLWMQYNLENVAQLFQKAGFISRQLADGYPKEYSEEFKYRSGNFKAISQLLTILPFGKQAKETADLVIDLCDEVQNLREAIWELKVMLRSKPDMDAARRASINNRGVQYVQRYAKLITFSSYLWHNKDAFDGLMPMETFTSFVQSRKEISTALRKLNFAA